MEIKPQDHPDAIGGIVWSECELRWINEKLATRDQQVAEACAEAVDRMPLRHAGRADLTANQAVETIRSGEWKKHMKGNGND